MPVSDLDLSRDIAWAEEDRSQLPPFADLHHGDSRPTERNGPQDGVPTRPLESEQPSVAKRTAIMFAALIAVGLGVIASFGAVLSSTDDDAEDSAAAANVTVVFPASSVTEPLALDTETTVSWDPPGSESPTVWNMSVGGVRDMTAEVLAFNDGNAAPPDGMVFAGFDVEMSLIDVDVNVRQQPITPRVLWDIVGGETNRVHNNAGELDPPCGDFADQMLGNALFIGGTLRGTECIIIPEVDLQSVDTVIAARVNERAYFGTDGTAGRAELVPSLDATLPVAGDPGDRSNPFPFSEPRRIIFSDRGDDVDSIWTVSFSAPEDITDTVVSAGSPDFIAELRDDHVFAGINIDITLESSEEAPKSFSPFVRTEIIGGASGLVYSARPLPNGCGPTPNQFFGSENVPLGESEAGLVCMQIHGDDIGHPNTRVALRFFDGSRLFFG